MGEFDLSPVLELGEVAVVERAPRVVRLILRIGHVLDEEVQQGILGLVGELPVGVAPLAVVFVEAPVLLPADRRIVGQRHPAALAIKCLRGAQQGVDGDAEFAGKDFEQFGVGLRQAGLPAAHGLPGHVDAFCHLLLRQVVPLAQVLQDFFDFHVRFFLVDSAKVAKETKAYRPIPIITDFTDENGNDNMDQMVKENYIQIKKDVKDIVAKELKRIAENPDLAHLTKK